ncbi:HAD-IIB family hydrolase [Acidihalobacter ferrooxydans]|uniref:sucrose-phosphate synthase n=1 Tax=Acidihalobacter ferrooxydans TaxID=1765967 RepID=A0A1P8UJ77_9GAMM|nr:HAD-IIB family hydrolase [Acidihalobacter ferrooxydans]APZ43831.1 HAD family hydrolase [Acidihalobacter ferrooxydans]
MHISLHGLVRGTELELGRDADTGGQIQYVLELVRALAGHDNVARVDLLTRRIHDRRIAPDYAEPQEPLDAAGKARIVRIPFGPRRYLRKEKLWPYLDCFVDLALRHVRDVGRVPDVIHAHYADAGLAGARLAALLGVPFVFTGHSLGREKRRRLLDQGQDAATIDERYAFGPRIEAEERSLDMASLIIASTQQEVEQQYAQYARRSGARIAVVPPGVDLSRFHPPSRSRSHKSAYRATVERFLRHPSRPWILALARADERKNLASLLRAYGEHPSLRTQANLVLIAGNREHLAQLDRGARTVWRELIELIDDYDLYGHVAYPKQHSPDDVPDLYRLAAASGGVFVNPALTEPFGLTLIEAAASGLPLIATDDGGPQEILRHCRNGRLIDPLDIEGIGTTLATALSDRARWKRWAQRGLRGVAQHYTWHGHATQYLRELERLVARNRRRPRSPRKSRLPTADRMLICDIDNTLLGNPEGLKRLIATLHQAGDQLAFGIATGRRLDSAVRVLKEWDVPAPDVLITAVGSEIHYGPTQTEDDEWPRHLDFRWDRQSVLDTLAEVPGLRLQPGSEQRAHKISYFADPQRPPDLDDLRRRLRERGAHVNVIYSHDAYLDILPIRASKGLAVRFVADRWGIDIDRVLVAGDSGNDTEMLSGHSLAVVVGNYSHELEHLRQRKRVYFASGHCAAGVLEGIEHYDFLGTIRQPQYD